MNSLQGILFFAGVGFLLGLLLFRGLFWGSICYCLRYLLPVTTTNISITFQLKNWKIRMKSNYIKGQNQDFSFRGAKM